MNFDWYNIFNLTDFIDTGLFSRTLTVILSGHGQKDILITRGNEVSIVYEDVMLPIKFEDDNPFTREGDDAHYAVYQDQNNDIWLGIESDS